MTRTIANTVSSTITLTASYDPLFVTSTGKISTSATAAIYGGAAQAWQIINGGDIQNVGQFGIELQSGSTVDNAGFISDAASIGEAVRINGGAGTLSNTATISGGYDGVVLTAGGSVTNTAGEIAGSVNDGVYISGGAGTVTNAGQISGGRYAVQFKGSFADRVIIDAGAVFQGKVAGGSRSNTLELAAGSNGSIGTLTGLSSNYTGFGTVTVDSGASWKLDSTSVAPAGEAINDAGTLANAGQILQTVTVESGGTFSNTGSIDYFNDPVHYGVSLSGSGVIINGLGGATDARIYGLLAAVLATGGAATIANAGILHGMNTYGVDLQQGGSIGNTGSIGADGTGIFISGAAGTLTNGGTITSFAFNSCGVEMMAGGTVTNTGTIISSNDIGVYIGFGAATVTNAGTISGSQSRYAIQFSGSFADRLIIDPGAVFSGIVQGGSGTNVLELAADPHGATGQLGTFASEFQNFGTINVDSGAKWQMDGSDPIAAGILLTDAGTLNSTGVIDTTVTVAAAGYFSNTGTVNAGTGQVGVTLLADGTVMNTAGHPLIEAARYGIRAQAAAATVVNNATILGTSSLNGGGIGLYAGGNITNNGTITGNGGNGVYIGGGAATLTNAGTITGVTDSVKFAGSFTDRVIDSAGAVFHGTVQGGGSSNTLELQTGAKAGTGTLSGFGTSFTNFGTVTVDHDAMWQFDATDTIGSAVLLTDNGTLGSAALIDATVTLSNFASLSNTGRIATGTTGVYGGNATLTNSGTIQGRYGGGANHVGNAAVRLAAGSRIVNSGWIGAGSDSYEGIVLNGGGTIINASSPRAAIAGDFIGVFGLAGGRLTVTNGGQIFGEGYGVSLAGGGLITNTGTIAALGPASKTAIRSSGVVATVANSGTIYGFTNGIVMVAGGSVSNTGSIGGANAGVYISGQAGTVTNGGTISGTYAVQFHGTFDDRVIMKPGAVFSGLVQGGTGTNTLELAAGSAGAVGTLAHFASFEGFGTLTVDSGVAWKIAAGNTIASSVAVFDNGTLTNAGVIDTTVRVGAGASLVNSGTIMSNPDNAGVYLLNGGALTNTGLLEYGCYVESGIGTVTNSGAIDGVYTGVGLFGGGTLTNTGQITTNPHDSNADGVDIQGGAGVVTNTSGYISGIYDGVVLSYGGTVVNQALISATLNTGVYIGGGAGTVTNAGTIKSVSLADAIQFGGNYADRVILDAGAVIFGGVKGSTGSNTLELAAGSAGVTGILDGFSSSFINFGTVAIDAGASWVFAASNKIGTSVAFTDAGKLSNAGLIDTAVTLSAAVSLGNTGTINGGSTQQGVVMLAGGTLVNAGLIEGSNGVSIAGGAGLVTNSSVIDGASYGVAMAKGGTVHNTGTIASTSHGEAVQIAGGAGTVTNTGSIGGSFDGVVLTGGGTVQNSGSISGSGNFGVYIGGGAGTLTNAGTISGSADAVEFSGSFADRVILDAGGVIKGKVQGGSGSNTLELAAGSAGAIGTLGSFATAFSGFGAIAIDSGANWTIASTSTILPTGASSQVHFTDAGALTNDGALDTTVAMTSNGSLANGGTISTSLGSAVAMQAGGTLGNTGTITATGASLLAVHATAAAATVTNTGYIAGGQDGVQLQAGGAVTNSGAIVGTSTAGVDVLGGAGTVTNSGTITGGTYAVQFGGAFTDRLILDPGAVLKGKVQGGSGTNTLELATGSTSAAGTLASFGGAFKSFSQMAVDAGATWSLTAANPFAGASVLPAVSLGGLATLNLTGGGAVAADITGTGTLQLGGSTAFSFAAADTLDSAALAIGASSTLSGTGTIGSDLSLAGTLAATSGTLVLDGALDGAGTVTAGQGAEVEILGGGILAGTLAGSGSFVMHAGLTLDAGAKLAASSILDTANLALGAGETVQNETGHGFTFSAASGQTLTLSGATGTAFTNAGTFTASGAGIDDISASFTNTARLSAAAGTLAFLGTATNTGTIDAASAAVSFSTSVAGTGELQIGATGTLSLALGAGTGQTADFLAGTGLLNLADPIAFNGTISGFSGSDRIDLLNTPESGYTYANNILSVTNGNSTVAALHFAGSSNSFSLTSDMHGGTLIEFK